MSTRSRTTADDLRRSGVDAFLAVAEELGLDAAPRDRSAVDRGVTLRLGADLVVDLNISVVSQALAGGSQLGPEPREHNTLEVLVADQIPAAVRESLNLAGHGWLDRRGHLRLVAPGIHIDTDVGPRPRRGDAMSTTPIAGRSGLAAAAALLMSPDDPATVAEIARRAGLNQSSISRALARLDEAQLAQRIGRGRYRPLVPELFWALAEVWPRERRRIGVTLQELERSQSAANPDDPASPRFVLSGERAAVRLGAPLVLTGDFPALVYAPTLQSVDAVLVSVAPGGGAGVAGDVVVDPTGLATVTGVAGQRSGGFQLAHPLFCALDLAGDSRGREALEQWDPSAGIQRVW